MPVVCRGKRVGRAIRAELSEDMTRLQGIWVGAGLRGTRYIPAEEIQMLGQVAIMADSLGTRRRMTASPLFQRATATNGIRLGAVTGAEVDEISLRVTALELSRGFWDDLLTRRQRISRFTASRDRGDIIIDTAEFAKEGEVDEGWHDQRADRGNADRLGSGDDVRRHELADRAQVEPDRQEDRKLDI